MDSQLLSSVVEGQLRSLCLNNFPCGHGSWSKSKGSKSEEQRWGYTEQDEGREGADKEEQEDLIDLLTCPFSPWRHEGSWSPEALTLRELSVQTPERLHGDFIFNHFSILRIVNKGVSIIDEGILKFSNLKELVLSANKISELRAEHLPRSLRVLELYANQLSDLKGLSCHQLPDLQHLGLGSNRLGSQADIQYLTGAFWPKLASLDLGWCGFQGQQALVGALATLPCLRSLVLEGNPFTLTPSYPGFTLDSLPRLFYLDASRVTPEDRHHFRGLAKMSELIVDQAAATVTVHRVRGIPDPHLAVDESTPEFPVVNYSYSVTYEFLGHQLSVDKQASCGSAYTYDILAATAHVKENGTSDIHRKQNESCEQEVSLTDTVKLDITGSMMDTEEHSHHIPVVRQSTSKLPWAECMDYIHSKSYIVGDLGSLKRFLTRGLWLTIEEEKVLSWPAPSVEVSVIKPTQNPKEKKGEKRKEAPNKAGSKDKSKDKKKSATELVQDAPIRRILGSVHVPLQTLVTGEQKVDILCDLGLLLAEPSVKVTTALWQKDSAKKIKDDKKKEDKRSKSGGESVAGQKNAPASKGKGKGCVESEAGVRVDEPGYVQLEPMTVEFSVQLEKWQSASEAHQLLPQHS